MSYTLDINGGYMKYISMILMSLFLMNNVNAKDYIFEGYGISELSTIEISDNFKFSAYTSEGMWDDSNGDYGNEKCSGYLKQQNKKVELEIFCETVNQNNEKFWNSRIRKSDEGAYKDNASNFVEVKSIKNKYYITYFHNFFIIY